MDYDAITCPVCHRTSHHRADVTNGYCGACHAFTGAVIDGEASLEAWCRVQGYVTAARNPRGGIVALEQCIANAQLVVGDEASVAERYSYRDFTDAFVAFVRWCAAGFDDEPDGWLRHQPSNRRRRDGDPAHEEIRP